jgi:hypothetical protein
LDYAEIMMVVRAMERFRECGEAFGFRLTFEGFADEGVLGHLHFDTLLETLAAQLVDFGNQSALRSLRDKRKACLPVLP